jgi:hypothetical protein
LEVGKIMAGAWWREVARGILWLSLGRSERFDGGEGKLIWLGGGEEE